MVTYCRKVKGEVPDEEQPEEVLQQWSGRRMAAVVLHNGHKGNRRLQQSEVTNCLDLHAIGPWLSLCQDQCGGCLCTSLPTLNDPTHRRSPEDHPIPFNPPSPMGIRKW